MRLIVSILATLLAACATSGSEAGDTGDASTDSAAAHDGAADTATTDAPAPADAATCTLGTPDHCGACDHACGADDMTTLHTCSDPSAAGTCSISCRAEYYDLDGNDANGCEANDPTVHDTSASATPITLPDANDPQNMSNPLNVVGIDYGDTRVHEMPPTSRPLGRDEWYHVTAVGTGQGLGMAACLGITNFPADDQFEVCISDAGGSTFPASGCKTVMGGAASVCVTPTGSPNAGTYYVRVRKLAGANTANGYALYLRH